MADAAVWAVAAAAAADGTASDHMGWEAGTAGTYHLDTRAWVPCRAVPRTASSVVAGAGTERPAGSTQADTAVGS